MGKKIQEILVRFASHNLAHFVASDAHNTTTRPFDLREAYEIVEKEFGMSKRYQVQENPEEMVQGKNDRTKKSQNKSKRRKY